MTKAEQIYRLRAANLDKPWDFVTSQFTGFKLDLIKQAKRWARKNSEPWPIRQEETSC